MDDWRSILQREFGAEPGSFLLQLRCEPVWDGDAYDRLVTAMEACCRAKAGEELVERWIATGFWYLSWFVEDWMKHPNFPREGKDGYLQAANEYLQGLAYWFFFDDPPWTDAGAQARAELSRWTLDKTPEHT